MPPRLPALDALRVAGAALVLFAHGGWYLFPAWPAYDAYLWAGWIGTEIFFALTGFLVTRELLALPAGELRTAWRYTTWRLFRILPLYWLALLAHLALAQASPSGVPEDAWRYPVLVQNLAWPHPSFFGEAWNLPLIVLVSLALPGLFLGAASFARPRVAMLVVLGLLIAIGIALRFEWIVLGASRWDEDVRKVVVARLDTVAYGALAALLAVRRAVAALTAAVAIAVATLLFEQLPRDASLAAKLGCFAASGAGFALACAALSAPWREQRWLVRLARWCWPLYLVNMPLLLGFALIGFGQSLSPSSSVLRFAAWAVSSVGLAALLHYLLERPLLDWGRARFKPSASGAASPTMAKTARGPGG